MRDCAWSGLAFGSSSSAWAPNSFTPGLQPLLEYRYITGLAGATLGLAVLLSFFLETPRLRRMSVPIVTALLLLLVSSTVVRNVAWRDGIQLWSDVLEKKPDRLRARNELAMAHFHSRYVDPSRIESAAEILREIRASNPNYIRGLANLGGVLREMGHHDEAIEVLEQMLTQPQVIPSAVLQLGLLYEEVDRLDDALAVWHEGQNFDRPHDTISLALRARLTVRLDRPEETVDACQRFWVAIEGRRNVNNVGEMAILHTTALFRLHRLDEALVRAERAEQLADTFARRVRAVVLQGDTLEAQGRQADAASQYDRAIDLLVINGVEDPDALLPVGDAALKAHVQARQSKQVGRSYHTVLEALPTSHREIWRHEHEWMTRIDFGE